MSVTETPEQKMITMKCDNCGNKYRVPEPNFANPYERAVWIDQTRLCKECTQLNIEPSKIKLLKNPHPKGAMWNPAEHGDNYLSQDISEEEMKKLEEKTEEIRKANMDLQRESLKKEFGGKKE